MKNDSITISTLAERVSKETGVEAEKVKQATNAFFDIITREILDSGSFKLIGFGTFNRMFVDESERKNPRTGETVISPAHYVVKFVPTSSLAKRINKPYEHLKTEVLEDISKKSEEQENKSTNDDSQKDKASEVSEKVVRGAEGNIENDIAKDELTEQSSLYESIFDDALEDNNNLAKTAVPNQNIPYNNISHKDISKRDFSNQTIPHQSVGTVIEHQVIQNQIIHQHIEQPGSAGEYYTNGERYSRNRYDDEQYGANERYGAKYKSDEYSDTDNSIYDSEFDEDFEDEEVDEEEVQRYVNRCWFFAGVAVILTTFILSICILAFVRRHKNRNANVTEKTNYQRVLESSDNKSNSNVLQKNSILRIAADDNLYAILASQQYGERNLWPYIFSANMLRFPDPDKPGVASDIIIPSKPNKAIDRRDIELSVIDAYDAYRSLISKRPNGKTADIRKEHAVITLLCGESLYSGFIDKYAIRLVLEDVENAREQIRLYENRRH